MLSAFTLSAPAMMFANPADPDGNPYVGDLAGRPLNGYSYDFASDPTQWINGDNGWNYYSGSGTGHVISYARYAGNIVALYPWHGRNDPSFDGKYVYGPNGSKIGYWLSDICSGGACGSNRDLAVIMLYQGNWPASKNKIVAGDPAQNQYWTITADPSSAYACGNLVDGSEWGDTVKQAFQLDINTTSLPRTGALGNSFFSYVTGVSGHCTVRTNLLWHNVTNHCPPQPNSQCPYRDSGSQYQLSVQNTSIQFFTTVYDENWNLAITPLYDGLSILNSAASGQGGAHLCHDASCS
jgi:hypothetical protein